MTRRVAVVMAGGSGERFWPLSRITRPKQFLRLAGGTRTLFEQAIDNIAPLFPSDHVFIATGKHLIGETRAAFPALPSENIIAEPCKRNTAGCLALAAAYILARYGGDGSDILMAVVAADHAILNPQRYRQILDTALTIADHSGNIVTLGINPTRPETGYGYIEAKRDRISVPGIPDDIPVFPVERFHEKPNRETAAEYVASGRFFWNSGMFFWRLSDFFRELTEVSPDIAHTVTAIAGFLSRGDAEAAANCFQELPNISIDYALMEKTRRVLVVESDFGWDDIGAWDALQRTMPKDESGNIAVGDPVLVDARDCIVYNEPGPERCAVAVVGVEGLTVIVSEDAVLVVPRDRVQEVRKAVEELKRRGASQV